LPADQGRRRPSRGSEQANKDSSSWRSIDGGDDTIPKHLRVHHAHVDRIFRRGEQVEEHAPEPCGVEGGGEPAGIREGHFAQARYDPALP